MFVTIQNVIASWQTDWA